MNWFDRTITSKIEDSLGRGKSVLLLGPRQTGKTSLVKKLPHVRYMNMMDLELLYRYKEDIGSFPKEMKFLAQTYEEKPIVIIDEIQKLPELTDYCQLLIDEKKIQFILTGSSVRQIKNLLPGRMLKHSLSGLNSLEIPAEHLRPLDFFLLNGSLPGIYSLKNQYAIDEDLASYVYLYLEEEIRKESLVRNLKAFSQFLTLACLESGNLVNLTALSQDIGVSHNTIAEYYRILEDCMLIKRIDPLTLSNNSRRKLVKSSKFIMFDLGVRRVGAKEGLSFSRERLGNLFEQYVGLEILSLLELQYPQAKLLYWRCHQGPEVDYVIEHQGKLIPIEVKLSTRIRPEDLKHLKIFRNEYGISNSAYVVSNIEHPMEIEDGIIGLPWHQINIIINSIK